jgi:hypothetical protein
LVLDLLDCLIMYVAWLYSIHIRKHAIRIIVFADIRKHAEWWALAMVAIDLDLWEGTIVVTLIRLLLSHAIVLLIIISTDTWLLFRTSFNHRA